MKLLVLLTLMGIGLISNAQNYIEFTTGKLSNSEKHYTMPQRQNTKAQTDAFSTTLMFEGAKINKTIRNYEEYQFIHIKGFGQTTTPGAPALPAHYDQVLAPKGTHAQIIIEDSEFIEIDGFNIHPALKPARDTYGATPPEWETDTKLYTADAFYPKQTVEITNTQFSRGFPILNVRLTPIQFNPVSGKLRIYKKLSYTVVFNDGQKSSLMELSENNTARFTQNLKMSIVNPQIVPEGKTELTKNIEKNYILITHDAYKAAADTLAQWKRQLGYTVEVVSAPSWSAAMVKDAIQSRYNAWTIKPDYFLILGDHGGNYPVPGEMYLAPDGDGYYATDLYYACMDGNYDFRPDMAHGRISVSTPIEAMDVVRKIVNYERSPVTDANFYNKGLTCAQFQDVADNEAPDGYAARRFAHTSEDIRDYTISQGYEIDRIYYTESENTPTNYNSGYYSDGQPIPAELLRSNGFQWNGNTNNIKNAINDGRFYVFHRDHGYSGGTGWSNPQFVTSSISSLANGDLLPVVFSINCHTGEFSLSKCFAEAFLRHSNGGAVGVIAASYYSYSGYNDGFSAGMMDAIWSNPGLTPNFGYGGNGNPPASDANNIRTMGDAMNQGLTRMEQTWGISEYTNRLFHYFGDPAMRIWTENPHNNTITASHSNSISCDETSFNISDCNTENAIATLVHGGEIIGTGIITGGTVNIDYTIETGYPSAILTISEENHKPYITTIQLTGTCNYAPITTIKNAYLNDQNALIIEASIVEENAGNVSASGIIYGFNPELTLESSDAIISNTLPTVQFGVFSKTISELESGHEYYFRAFATNNSGTGYSEIKSITTTCSSVNTFPYTTDFSQTTPPACWEIEDANSYDQKWEFTNPGERTFNSSTGDNGFAIVDSDFYDGSGTQNTHLISPIFDFSIYGVVQLNFEHYYRHATSSTATLAYTTDDGLTWIDINQWISTVGSFTSAANYEIDLSEELAYTENVRFRWTYLGDNDFYWVLDDIEITTGEFKRYKVRFDDSPINMSDTIFSYTQIPEGSDEVFSFEIENIGDLPLTIENANTANGEFTIETPPASTLAPSTSSSFEIKYTPQSTNSGSSQFSFETDAPTMEEFTGFIFANLASAYDVTINVINAYGAPIENASINFTNGANGSTDSNGTVTIPDLESATTHGYTISASNFEDKTTQMSITHENIERTHLLTANPINLTFLVTDGIANINNAIINISNGPRISVSDGLASTQVPGVQPMSFTVEKYGFDTFEGTANLTLNDTTINVVLEPTGYTVNVTVTTNNQPVENAAVTVQSSNPVYTDSEGFASVRGIAPGYYRQLNVNADGYEAYNENVDIFEDTELTVSLDPNSYTLSVKALYNNEPVNDASIAVDGITQQTNTAGIAMFENIAAFPTRSISLTKSGLEPITHLVNFYSDTLYTFHMQLVNIDQLTNNISAYPNPASSAITIESNNENITNIKLFNTLGQVVAEQNKLSTHKTIIETDQVKEGLYYLVITTTQQSYSKSMFIRR